MPSQQPTRASIKTVFMIMLIGAALIALIATFLPSIVGFDDETTTIMRVVLYAAAAVSVGQAFWLKAKLTRQLPPEERRSGGTIQRQ
ncbi:MAG TPA: hypothetical protein VJ790_06590 [Dongiaceae bacterium]|nr:hypothetical protein [Dongiaceae bacterium]